MSVVIYGGGIKSDLLSVSYQTGTEVGPFL